MSKKAQGMSLNVIIIAILALLVLVVLAVIFLGRINVFGKGVSDCDRQPDHVCTSDLSCRTTSAGDSMAGYVRDTTYNCADIDNQKMFCCFKAPGTS